MALEPEPTTVAPSAVALDADPKTEDNLPVEGDWAPIEIEPKLVAIVLG